MNTAKETSQRKKYKLIYNPNAGKKRRVVGSQANTLESITELIQQYQLEVDFAPTEYAGHATILARESIEEGYECVLVAGGDGTVGEVANGLVGSDVILGILPLGTYMNVARMLAVPNELEKAVMLIKMGRTRKIDVGSITRIDGEKLSDPYYFLENSGTDFEALFQEYFKEFEDGNFLALFKLIKLCFSFYRNSVTIRLDDEEIRTWATLITISNGPYTGASLELAPDAKLNDHKLTVSLYKMSTWELLRHFVHVFRFGGSKSRKIKTYQAKVVRLSSNVERRVHADARLFGTMPVEYKVVPNALNVIVGFPKPGESALVKRTYLDP